MISIRLPLIDMEALLPPKASKGLFVESLKECPQFLFSSLVQVMPTDALHRSFQGTKLTQASTRVNRFQTNIGILVPIAFRSSGVLIPISISRSAKTLPMFGISVKAAVSHKTLKGFGIFSGNYFGNVILSDLIPIEGIFCQQLFQFRSGEVIS